MMLSYYLILLLLVVTPLVTAFPAYLVNECDRDLQIGSVIMGNPCLEAAEADEVYTVTLLNADGSSACGTTVEQGQELTIQIDSNLVNANGPQYIIETTSNSLLQADADATLGCGNTRMVNSAVSTIVAPLQTDELSVRLLYAFAYGQVYLAESCSVTVAGTRTVATYTGYLVDTASWDSDNSLATSPNSLTVEQLLASGSDFAVLMETDEAGTFDIKYLIEDTDKITSLLQSLDGTSSDIQISIVGFESDNDATTIEQLVSVSQCASATTCEGFYEASSEKRVCIAEGFCIESSIVDEEENTLTTTIVTNDDSWLGIGFSTPGGGMTAGGTGSDIFVCSSEGLRRFVVTAKTNPSTQAAGANTETGGIIEEDEEDDEEIRNLCILDTESGTGRMTFTRGLTNDGPRDITIGTAQAIIYARGPLGEQSLAFKHPADRRGEVSLDLTDISSVGNVEETKAKAPWILWFHIICMSLSWGLLLPLAVILASRTRQIGPVGRWFSFHKQFARIGWTLQTMGVIFGVYYVEVYNAGSHLQSTHTKMGIPIVIAGFLQPISALLRPHPPKDGWPNGRKPVSRVWFEIYHKGVGWLAMIAGMVNVFLGAKLAMDLSFEEIVATIPRIVGGFGSLLFFLVLVWSFSAKKRRDD